MTRQRPAIVVNGAASQYSRWLCALAPGYARVDGRSLAELLDFAPQFGELINFYDLRDEVAGDWVQFFSTDPTLILAAIEAADVDALAGDYQRLERRTAAARFPGPKFELLRQLFELVHGLARRVDLWLRGLALGIASRHGERLRREIAAEVDGRLGSALRRLKAYDEGAGVAGALGRPIGLDYSRFGGKWRLGRVTPDGSIYRGDGERRRMDSALEPLYRLFTSFAGGFSALQSVTAGQLVASLESGDQKPQLALYIAFVELFRSAQTTLDTISSRYIRFYYRRVLREGRRGAVPDRVFLTFLLEEGVAGTTVPQGTLFPAGEDADGNQILFALERQLAVSAAQIAEILTLRVLHGPLYVSVAELSAGSDDADGDAVPRQILSSIVATGVESDSGWATFGAVTAGTTETEVTEPSSLGFALASPYLLLTGGERWITLTVEVSQSFYDDVLEPRLERLAAATGLGAMEVWGLVLEQAFRFYFSTADEWFPYAGSYTVMVEGTETEAGRAAAGSDRTAPWFAFALNLPPSAPPVQGTATESEDEDAGDEEAEPEPVTAGAEAVAADPAPDVPTLKACLRQQPVVLVGDLGAVEVYPLSLLDGLEVRAFDLDTDVSGLVAETLESIDGELDPSSPFTVFGGVPTVGAYLQVSHSEVFAKIPETLSLGIRWFGLPPNSDGFKGWYRDYVINLDGEEQANLFDNQVFLGAFSLRNPGSWRLTPTLAPTFLFRTDNDCDDPLPTADGKLCPASGFALEASPSSDGVSPYYDPADSALRLTLTAPDTAFGNDLYAQNVLKAVIDNLPDTQGCQDRCEAECSPLSEAATLLAACLAKCSGVSDADYPQCLQPCLDQCQDILLAGAQLCVLRCLIRLREVDPEAHAVLHTEVRECRRLPAAARAATLVRVLEEVRSRAADRGADSEACRNRCRAFFRGYSCITECRTQCTGINPGEVRRCLAECLTLCQVELSEAYGKCVQSCVEECTQQTGELKYPNEPYLPQAEAVTLGYTARTSPSAFFHLLPFGGYGEAAIGSDGGALLLPELPDPGNLYLGFSQLIPPQDLTLLVQMTTAEDPVPAADLPAVEWQVLDGNAWTALEPAEILADTTSGLENTGILKLGLPRYDADDHTVAPADYQWLRASVAAEPDRFPRTLAITPHAATAVWTPDEEAPEEQTGDHLDEPVPAGTITSSVQDLADIESIDQPMASFGGRPPENRRRYEIRLGERLRHKDRAVLGWDYERLVLERFPAIWKVQALPARDLDGGNAPGKVLVVVVPGPDLGEAMDPTVPRAPGEVLRQIRTDLEGLASPFVDLEVVNPLYVRITVTAEVEFRDDGEGGGSIGRLDDDLVRYLSPWFYDAARASKGGRYASEADVSEFVQTRPYVQRLVSIDFAYSPQREDLEWYFLTSAAEHSITEVIPQTGGSNPPCTQEIADV